jgi:hypothetical protein
VPAESFYLGYERDRHPLLNPEGFNTGYADFDDLQKLSRGCETLPIIGLSSRKPLNQSTLDNRFLGWIEPYPTHCDIGDYTFPEFSSMIRCYEDIRMV